MKQTTDIIIIGAGIIGLCTALELRKRSSTLSITIMDRALLPGTGSTGASSAVCRHLYTHDEVMRLARDGVNKYRDWSEYIETSKPLGKYNEIGVLWLGRGQQQSRDDVERLSKFGVVSHALIDEDLRERFPQLNTCAKSPDFETGEDHDCAGGETHLFEETGGWFDPQDALQDLVQSVRAKGVDIQFDSAVKRVLQESDRVSGVELEADVISAPVVINASGPWCNELLEPFGFLERWSLVPTRIQTVYAECSSQITDGLPVCADLVSGIYFRPEKSGHQIVVGSTLPEDEKEVVDDPNEFDRLADDDFAMYKLHALHHRLPDLSHHGRVSGCSGLYTVSTVDMHPIVGSTPVEGFYVANGFSGHGFKLAPAIGSLLAQEITGDKIASVTDVPIEFLSWKRAPIKLDSKSVLA